MECDETCARTQWDGQVVTQATQLSSLIRQVVYQLGVLAILQFVRPTAIYQRAALIAMLTETYLARQDLLQLKHLTQLAQSNRHAGLVSLVYLGPWRRGA